MEDMTQVAEPGRADVLARVAGSDADLIRELADRARAEGLELTDENGLHDAAWRDAPGPACSA